MPQGWMPKGYQHEHGDITRADMQRFMQAYIQQHGYAPTHTEIARACYITPPVVRWHLKVMARLGIVAVDKYKHRGIRLIEQEEAA